MEKHLHLGRGVQLEAEFANERPRIEEYGTLAELTAGSKSGAIDDLLDIAVRLAASATSRSSPPPVGSSVVLGLAPGASRRDRSPSGDHG